MAHTSLCARTGSDCKSQRSALIDFMEKNGGDWRQSRSAMLTECLTCCVAITSRKRRQKAIAINLPSSALCTFSPCARRRCQVGNEGQTRHRICRLDPHCRRMGRPPSHSPKEAGMCFVWRLEMCDSSGDLARVRVAPTPYSQDRMPQC
jgi:hypothetical protein